MKSMLSDAIDGLAIKRNWRVGLLTIGLSLAVCCEAPSAQEGLEQTIYDCRSIAPAQPSECQPGGGVISELLHAADAYEFGSHLPPGDNHWRRMLTALNHVKTAVDPDQLSLRERVATQNAALRIALLATVRATDRDDPALVRSLLQESSGIVAAFALAADQLPTGDAADEIASWLGPSGMRIEERLRGDDVLFHEAVYWFTRTFRMVRIGDRRSIFSQLVTIDTMWHPHVTPIVGEIEIRTSIDSKQRACIAKLDLELGRCGARLGLRPLDDLPIRHLGGYVRVDAAGGANCIECHSGRGPFLNSLAARLGAGGVIDLESAEVAPYLTQHNNSTLQQLEGFLAQLRSKLHAIDVDQTNPRCCR
jgi:hypothetical protein